MFRHVVSLLVLQCAVLGPMVPVALAHAHEGGQPVGHDSRPHAHTNPPRPAHSHHKHDRDGHHHDHADADTEDCPSVPRAEEPADHDSDAVYVASADAVPGSRAVGDEERPISLGWVGSPVPAAVSRLSLVPKAVNQNRPPPGRACPIYVRHLAILI